MSFKLENFGADASNVKSILGGANYYRYFNKDNNTLTTPGYFPSDLGLAVGDRIKVIPSVKTNPDELYVVTSTANRTVTVTQIDTNGAVDSVNGKTGAVVLKATDVSALPQYNTMPTASADNEGQTVQFTGVTDANYTNGYFYKCTGAGEPIVYSWTQADVQPAAESLPDQSGQSGKFLTTDGTDASWATLNALQNTATGTNSLTIDGSPASGQRTVSIGYGCNPGSFSDSVVIGNSCLAQSTYCVVIGAEGRAGNYCVAIGNRATAMGSSSIAIGERAQVPAGISESIQLGYGTNNTSHTLSVGLGFYDGAYQNYTLLTQGGTIPADRIASTSGLADGNYRLRLTMLNGVPTLTWVAE